MQYVLVLDAPQDIFDGDDSIEGAARLVNDALRDAHSWREGGYPSVRPLSEVIAS